MASITETSRLYIIVCHYLFTKVVRPSITSVENDIRPKMQSSQLRNTNSCPVHILTLH